MNMSDTRLLVVHARSPLHCGTGQSAEAVDLPIARDRSTTHPLIPGSSLKGALRNASRSRDTDHEVALFGPDKPNASDHAGSLAFSDARLVLLPVRSVAGTFAWITCPWALQGLRRDGALCGVDLPPAPVAIDAGCAWVTTNTALTLSDKRVVLEEFDLKSEPRNEVDAWLQHLASVLFEPDWRPLLGARLCLVADDVFTFLAKHATDIVTRVSIDPESGTANDGQLWTEENLPTESVLVGAVQATPYGPARVKGLSEADLFDRLTRLVARPVQLGGKATVGRGRCALRVVGA